LSGNDFPFLPYLNHNAFFASETEFVKKNIFFSYEFTNANQNLTNVTFHFSGGTVCCRGKHLFNWKTYPFLNRDLYIKITAK